LLTLKATGAMGSTIAQSAQLTNAAPNLARTASTTISSPPPPPTVSGTSNLTVGFGKSGTASFSLAGTGVLTVTASSSNTTRLPDANISGASACTAAGNCTLTLQPAANQAGTATVTVTVTDAYGQSGSGTFQGTVKAAPAPPSGSGDGSLGWPTLAALFLLMLVPAWRRRRHVGSN
jgi:MYXO-CTERM domain-containing protein